MANLNYLHILLVLAHIYSEASVEAIEAANVALGKISYGTNSEDSSRGSYANDGIISNDNHFQSRWPSSFWSVNFGHHYFVTEINVYAVKVTQGSDLIVVLAGNSPTTGHWDYRVKVSNPVFVNSSVVAYRYLKYTPALIEPFLRCYVQNRRMDIFILTEVQVLGLPRIGFVPAYAVLVPEGKKCVILSWTPPHYDVTLITNYEFRCDGETNWQRSGRTPTVRYCDYTQQRGLTCQVGAVGTPSVVSARLIEPWCMTAPPTMDHATYSLRRDNLTAIYQCDRGYISILDVISLCSSPHNHTIPWTWNTPPTSCRPEPLCRRAPPSIYHATYRWIQDSFTTIYQCESGHMSIGEVISVCSSPDILNIPWTWNTPQSSCRPEQWCRTAPPTMNNSAYRLSGDNLSAIYQCDSGYISIVELISVCSSPDISDIPWTWNTPQSSCLPGPLCSAVCVVGISIGSIISGLVIIAIGFNYFKNRKNHLTPTKSKRRHSLHSNQSAMLK